MENRVSQLEVNVKEIKAGMQKAEDERKNGRYWQYAIFLMSCLGVYINYTGGING